MAIRSTTTFAEVLALTGMSHAEAAEYLDLSLPTIQAYSQGKARTQPEPLAALWELYIVIRDGLPAEFMLAKTPRSVRRRHAVAIEMKRLIECRTDSAIPYRALRVHLGDELKTLKEKDG